MFYEPIKPFLANPGKLIHFFRNFQGHEPDQFLENSSKIFSLFQFSGPEPPRFLSNPSLFGWVFLKSICATIWRLFFHIWTSFPEIYLAHTARFFYLRRIKKNFIEHGNLYMRLNKIMLHPLCGIQYASCRRSRTVWVILVEEHKFFQLPFCH